MQCRKCKNEIPDGSAYCNLCGKKQQTGTPGRRTRANGQGSVYKLPNGKWRAEKTLRYEPIEGTDPVRCRRIYVTRSDFTRKVDALDYLPILGTEADTRRTKQSKLPNQPPDKTLITLKELYDLWQPTWQKSRSTMNCYAAGFAVFKDVWNVRMKDQDIDDLQECIDSCGKGKRTRANARTALGLVYKYGMPRGYVPSNAAGKPNLAEFLRVGEGETTHKEGLSVEELQTVRENVSKVAYADYILCHCYLGFRPSAFVALRTEDYNRTERAFVGGIKTEAGIDRTVTVSPKILPVVEELVGSSQKGYVFADKETGNPLSIRKYREIFYETLDALGIQRAGEPPHRLTPHS